MNTLGSFVEAFSDCLQKVIIIASVTERNFETVTGVLSKSLCKVLGANIVDNTLEIRVSETDFDGLKRYFGMR